MSKMNNRNCNNNTTKKSILWILSLLPPASAQYFASVSSTYFSSYHFHIYYILSHYFSRSSMHCSTPARKKNKFKCWYQNNAFLNSCFHHIETSQLICNPLVVNSFYEAYLFYSVQIIKMYLIAFASTTFN